MSEWGRFLADLKAGGGSTDMQTSQTGRYPYNHHFVRGAKLDAVVIYAHRPWPTPVLVSPARDWTAEAALRADYAALRDAGGFFNDTHAVIGDAAPASPEGRA